MKRIITYSFLLFILLSGCEDVYRPDIEEVDNVLVIDARISADEAFNFVHLYESVAYYDNASTGPAVTNADVRLIDSNGNEYVLPHYSEGQYGLNQTLDRDLQYKLKIDYRGDVYESSFEKVPEKLSIDSVYGFEEVEIRHESGDNDIDNIDRTEGVRLYADISKNDEIPYCRFTARFVTQYNYTIGGGSAAPKIVYGWKTLYPQGTFNIATLPEYSATEQIRKHPLYFLKNRVKYVEDYFFTGWIVILHQHALPENAYSYYQDLNKQLNSEGKIFDPLYVQARSNIECTSNASQKILGNFEISVSTETRYFLRYMSESDGFILREIDERIDIPFSGELIDVVPDFWQYP